MRRGGCHGRDESGVKAERLRPSELGEAELAGWRRMAAASAPLRRAFFSPAFARACEAAHGRAYVAVLHEAGAVRGLLPFQFASRWHRLAGLAERIGGELSDAAGLISDPDTRIVPAAVLRQCGAGVLFMTHLAEGQDGHGLTAARYETGHVIDLAAGPAAYLARLRPDFVRDTERRLRRAERELGALQFGFNSAPTAEAALAVIARKRVQYRRTGTSDPFAVPHRLRLIEALCATPAPDCRPVLARLTAGGRLLAEHLGLCCGNTLSYWFPVYDPATDKLSPGRLLLWHQIAQAEACGIALIDRGEGDTPAKQDFSTGTQRFGVANYTAAGLRGAVARLAQAAAWRLG